MAIIIKSLANQRLNSASSFVNVYPDSGTATRPALIKSMRFVNVSDTTAATLTLQLTHGGTTKQIGPTNISVPAKGLYVEKQEITLGVGDAIKARGAQFDYVISGIEREA